MFTGIVEEVGAISRRSGADLGIMAKVVLEGIALGDSIAVDGVCLTVAALSPDGFVARVSPETLERTSLARCRAGDAVNLERAMAADGRFGGHFVLGHVDGLGRIAEVRAQGEFSLIRFQASAEVARYLVPKGSVAIDGVSLTVIEPAGDTFGVAVIPTTLAETTLGLKGPGDTVNLEADVLGKHVYHYLKGGAPDGVSMGFLQKHGFA